MPVISNPPPGMMMYGPPGAPPGPYGPMRPQSPPPEIMYSHVGDPPGAPQQQPMAMVPRGRSRPPSHIPLAKLRVLYLGSAVPLQTREGLQAVQGPLRERYPYMSDGDVSGIDAWVTIFSSGILMKYINETNTVAWFPIQSLHVCAAVKCVVTGVGPQRQANFVALDSPEGRSSKHPPMFACIMRRTKGVKVLECHAFITKSNQAALAAVQACTHAYDHKEGWTDDFPNTDGQHNSNESRLVAADPVPVSTAPPEFFEKPPAQGYFYTSKKDIIKTYNVFGDRRGDSMVQTAAPRQARSDMRPAPKRQLAPPPAPMSAMPALGPTLPLPPPMGVPTPDSQLGLFPPGAIPMAPPPIFMPGLGPGMLPPGVQFIAPPQPPASVLANGHPLMMPAPPAGYFADYDRYAGQPFNVFPLEPNKRSSRSRHKKHRHKKSFHSPPKVREVRRARSASPAYSTSDIYGDYDYDDQYVYDERPPREPREEREVARRPERRADPPERSQKFRDGIPRDYDYDDQYVYDKRPPREPREEREVARRPERRADPPERSDRYRDGIHSALTRRAPEPAREPKREPVDKRDEPRRRGGGGGDRRRGGSPGSPKRRPDPRPEPRAEPSRGGDRRDDYGDRRGDYDDYGDYKRGGDDYGTYGRGDYGTHGRGDYEIYGRGGDYKRDDYDAYGDYGDYKRGGDYDRRDDYDDRDVYGDYDYDDKVYGDYGGFPAGYDRRAPPSDLEVYAPRYQTHIGQKQRSRSLDAHARNKKHGDDYVEYNSTFNPDIYMRGSPKQRGRGRGRERDYPEQDCDQNEDIYNRGYDREIEQRPRYPRQDREFANSIREERRVVGDYDDDDRDYYGDDGSVDYDMFGGRDRHPGKTYDGMGKALGYYP